MATSPGPTAASTTSWCVVSSSSNKAAAHAFISRVLSKKGQAKLRKYGFLPRVKAKHKRHHKKS